MIDRAPPAVARRIRLSTGAIFAAVILTCAAMLAIVAAVRPVYEGDKSSVLIEGPISGFSSAQKISVKDDAAAIIPVTDTQAVSR
jgi:hypothetical protein